MLDNIAARRVVLRTIVEVARDADPGSTLALTVALTAARLLNADGLCADCPARPPDYLPRGTIDPRCCDSAERRAARSGA